MRIKVNVRPGGLTSIRTLDAGISQERGAAGVLSVLKIFSTESRIPFDKVSPVESHRNHTHEEEVSYREAETELAG